MQREANQVEIKIVQLQITEALIHRFLDICWRVVCIPKFACHKNVFPGDAGSLDALSYLRLVAINRSRVDVSVPCLESCYYRKLYLARLR